MKRKREVGLDRLTGPVSGIELMPEVPEEGNVQPVPMGELTVEQAGALAASVRALPADRKPVINPTSGAVREAKRRHAGISLVPHCTRGHIKDIWQNAKLVYMQKPKCPEGHDMTDFMGKLYGQNQDLPVIILWCRVCKERDEAVAKAKQEEAIRLKKEDDEKAASEEADKLIDQIQLQNVESVLGE